MQLLMHELQSLHNVSTAACLPHLSHSLSLVFLVELRTRLMLVIFFLFSKCATPLCKKKVWLHPPRKKNGLSNERCAGAI